jgi:hypothetical protein
VDASDLTPFRLSKPFEEHMPDVLDSLVTDPDGMCQVTYRVGPLVISAQVWRDPEWNKTRTEVEALSEFDLQFLKELRVAVSGEPSAESALS